ncbi:MAG: MauE/DoxX family redox-associated membrane protein [Micromonosporaceae bacterium]
MTTTLRGWLALVPRLLLAGVWLYAGASKASDLPGSIRAVNAYQLMPYDAAQVVGAALPFVELMLGVLLLAGLGQRATAIASAILLAGFVAGIAAAWARGLRIDCGCFGGGGALAEGSAPRYGIEIARDIGLLLAAGLLAAWPRTPVSIDAALTVTEPTALKESQ